MSIFPNSGVGQCRFLRQLGVKHIGMWAEHCLALCLRKAPKALFTRACDQSYIIDDSGADGRTGSGFCSRAESGYCESPTETISPVDNPSTQKCHGP